MSNLDSISEIQKVIFLAIENTYGVDQAPVATDAILTEDFKCQGSEVNKETRNIDRLGFGGTEDAIGAVMAKVNFKIPLTGSGAAGTLANFSNALRAHQMNAVVDAGVSVTHNLVSEDVESASIYFYKGDKLRKIIGYRGSVGFEFKNGSLPYMVLTGEALYGVPEEATPPTPNASAVRTAQPITYQNTPVFTFNGVDLVLISFDISAPGNVAHRSAPNQEQVRVSGRRNYQGKMTVLQRDLASFNPEALMLAQGQHPLVIQHGTAPGDIATLTAPRVQIVGVSEGEDNGDATWEVDLNITASDAGDDDFTLVLT